MSRLDYTEIQARLKNALLAAQGHYDLGDPAGGELVLVSQEQAAELRSWWVSQIVSAWDVYNETIGTLPERQQAELQAEQDRLLILDLESENGVWLAYTSAVDFWRETGRTAILLNSLGVVSSLEDIAWDSIGEAIREAPDRIGEALGATVTAVGRTAGEALFGFIKGLGVTALLIAGVTVGAIIVLRRLK